MTANSLITGRPTCFQFKASFAPCTILQITKFDFEDLKTQIAETIKRAPNFFIGSPIVIDLEKVRNSNSIDFLKLKEILMNEGMVPMGVRGGTPEQHTLAATFGLPTLTIGKLAHAEPTKRKNPEEHFQPSKLVTTPIRSGMQIYAKEADLIVTASVSAGAELLADGNIHVYGRLRGRALAGVQGNTQARIFCHSLEAELISIAGYYLTKEDIQTLPESRGMIQVYLADEQVRIEAI